MQDDKQHLTADVRAVREQLRTTHARGRQAHERFLAANAHNDLPAMREAAREHTAINRDVLDLLSALREHLRRLRE